MVNDIVCCEFISKSSSAGIVNVELGFAPDFAVLITNHGGTNPNVYFWANNSRWSNWAAALALLVTGSTGVITRETSGPTVYAGGDTVASAETADTAGKHVDLTGTPASAGHITAAGLAIPAALQTASGRNFLWAGRVNAG
jgi:hypothetical protein